MKCGDISSRAKLVCQRSSGHMGAHRDTLRSDVPHATWPVVEIFEAIELGTYLHFKGGRYRALMEGKDSETTAPVVIYVNMHTGVVWVRPSSEWLEPISWPDSTVRPRFLRQDFE